MSSGMQHPQWETILANLEGESADASVKAHVTSCPSCARIAEALRELIDSLGAVRLPAVPSALIDKTIASLQTELNSTGAASSARGPGFSMSDWLKRLGAPVRELAARLVADSLAPSAALRGAGAASPRTLLYEAEDFSLSLGLAVAEDSGLTLRGQITTQSGEDLPADGTALMEGGDGLVERRLSEFGEFTFTRMPSDAREISVFLGNRLVRVKLPD